MREHVYVQPAVLEALRGRFGPEVVAADGSVNRATIAGIVFVDDSAMKWLEELTHPVLFALWRERLGAEPTARWVVEVPLLFEKQLENWFDFIACVACAPGQQLTRLEQRGLTRALAAQRISKQLPLARKIELADFVMLNDGSTQFLQQQVDLLIDRLSATR